MGVAALSTSAIALTAGSTPPPAGPAAAEAAPAFAKLVAQAKSEEKAPGQQASDPESGADGDGANATAAADDAAPAPIEATPGEKGTEQPLDLLAEMEAMVAAAGQIVVAQPAPVVQAAAQPATIVQPDAAQPASAPAMAEAGARLAGEPVMIGRTIARLAATATATAPLAQPAGAIDPSGTKSVPATSLPVAAGTAPAAMPTQTVETAQRTLAGSTDNPATDAEQASFEAIAANGGGAPTVADEPIPATADATAPARPLRGNIATLLASLKSALTPGKPADMIEARPEAEASASLAPAAATTAQPAAVSAAPIIASETSAPALPTAIADTASDAVAPAAPAELVENVENAEPMIAAAPKAGKAAVAKATPSPASVASQAATLSVAAGDAAPKADGADLSAPTLSTPVDAAPAAASIPATAPLPDQVVQANAALAGVRTDQPAAAPAAPAVDGTAPAASAADMAVDRHLDLARDSQWLDRLARDISQAATQQGHLKFQLNPEHLGALVVEIANGAAGTAIKLTAETDQARAIIADAQPQLLAEVRAQGLRIAETRVELNNQPQQQGSTGSSAFAQNQQGQAGQQRQSSADHQPFARTQAASRDDAGDSAAREDGELYA